LLARLGAVKSPAMKNMSAIMLRFSQAQNRSKPNQRWLSMIGKACQR
jgi:hypothetical protein